MSFMGNMWEKIRSLCVKHHISIPRASELEIDDGEELEDSMNRLKRMGFNTDTGKRTSAPSRGTPERPWWPEPHEIPMPPVTVPRAEPSPRSMFHIQEQLRNSLIEWRPYASRFERQMEPRVQREAGVNVQGELVNGITSPRRVDGSAVPFQMEINDRGETIHVYGTKTPTSQIVLSPRGYYFYHNPPRPEVRVVSTDYSLAVPTDPNYNYRVIADRQQFGMYGIDRSLEDYLNRTDYTARIRSNGWTTSI